jgi:uncharacterized membrane protein
MVRSPRARAQRTAPWTAQRTAQRWRLAEHLAALALGLLVLAVHDVGYLLTQSYWNDESWVAITARFPLSRLPVLTDSTPIGWSLLMRLLTVPQQETARLLPLAFAGAAVVIAYWLGRQLGWPRPAAGVIGGLLTGAAVLLVPAMLVQGDLKQYTADSCLALAVLALTSRAERQWSRPALAALSAAVWGGMLVSHTTAFVGAAAFTALCITNAARRNWRRLAEAAVAGLATAVLMLAVYEAFDARAVSSLLGYWSRTFPPAGSGPAAVISFAASRYTGAVSNSLGLGPARLMLALVAAGLVTLFLLGRPATAVTLIALWPGMLVLAALHKYPFLDIRTSTFLLTVTTAVAAIGVAGACALLLPRLKGVLAVGLAVAAVTIFTLHVQHYVRSHRIPVEDVSEQASYVAAHAAPGDAILVNGSNAWGFAVYWPHGNPSLRPDRPGPGGYQPYFPDQPHIVIPLNRNAPTNEAALSQALAIARRESCGRIWLVFAHIVPAEKLEWQTDFRQARLTPVPVGSDGLSVLNLGGPACG